MQEENPERRWASCRGRRGRHGEPGGRAGHGLERGREGRCWALLSGLVQSLEPELVPRLRRNGVSLLAGIPLGLSLNGPRSLLLEDGRSGLSLPLSSVCLSFHPSPSPRTPYHPTPDLNPRERAQCTRHRNTSCALLGGPRSHGGPGRVDRPAPCPSRSLTLGADGGHPVTASPARRGWLWKLLSDGPPGPEGEGLVSREGRGTQMKRNRTSKPRERPAWAEGLLLPGPEPVTSP